MKRIAPVCGLLLCLSGAVATGCDSNSGDPARIEIVSPAAGQELPVGGSFRLAVRIEERGAQSARVLMGPTPNLLRAPYINDTLTVSGSSTSQGLALDTILTIPAAVVATDTGRTAFLTVVTEARAAQIQVRLVEPPGGPAEARQP